VFPDGRLVVFPELAGEVITTCIVSPRDFCFFRERSGFLIPTELEFAVVFLAFLDARAGFGSSLSGISNTESSSSWSMAASESLRFCVQVSSEELYCGFILQTLLFLSVAFAIANSRAIQRGSGH
jgi:hypothetical protein